MFEDFDVRRQQEIVEQDEVLLSIMDPCFDQKQWFTNKHSDGTHSQQRIHWWASDLMLNFSKSAQMKKQTHLFLEWPESEYIYHKLFIFWVDCYFKTHLCHIL